MSRSAKVPLSIFREQTALPREALYVLLESKALPLELVNGNEILVDTTKISTATLEAALSSSTPQLDLSENSVLAEQVRRILDDEIELIVKNACELVSKREDS